MGRIPELQPGFVWQQLWWSQMSGKEELSFSHILLMVFLSKRKIFVHHYNDQSWSSSLKPDEFLPLTMKSSKLAQNISAPNALEIHENRERIEEMGEE